MKSVVTPNYKHRRDKERWLLREEAEETDSAKPFPSIVATGVVFGGSTKREMTFGCNTIAICETAKGYSGEIPKDELDASAQKLRFNGLEFVEDESGVAVPECEKLYLGADGSMLAVIKGSKAKPTALGKEAVSTRR